MTYNFKAIANEIIERGINLFGNEDDWFKGSMALSNLGDDGKGNTFAEVCASSAVSFADALIAELRKQSNPEGKPEKRSYKKEVAIGEVVEYQGEHLLCVDRR